jgi:hypothetical protein
LFAGHTSRAIFHAALVLLLFLDFRRIRPGPSAPPLIVDPSLDVDWSLLAEACSGTQRMAFESGLAGGSPRHQSPSAKDYLYDNSFGLSIQCFTEGNDIQLDTTR